MSGSQTSHADKAAFNAAVRTAKEKEGQGLRAEALHYYLAAQAVVPSHGSLTQKITYLRSKLSEETGPPTTPPVTASPEASDTAASTPISTASPVVSMPAAGTDYAIANDTKHDAGDDDDDDDDVVVPTVRKGGRPAATTVLVDCDSDSDAEGRGAVNPAAARAPIAIAAIASISSRIVSDDDSDGDDSPIPLRAPYQTTVAVAKVAAATAAAEAPASTASSSSPSTQSDADGYGFEDGFATLPGGFRLPRKLFLALYPYQRRGVAWMWSLHGAAPVPLGSLGRDAEMEGVTYEPPPIPAGHMTHPPRCPQLNGGILADDMGERVVHAAACFANAAL